MSAKERQKLVIWLDERELEILQRAVGVEDCDAARIAAWAKETLLETARSHPQVQEARNGDATQPPPPRPMCGCGETASPTGECDLSCITRY